MLVDWFKILPFHFIFSASGKTESRNLHACISQRLAQASSNSNLSDTLKGTFRIGESAEKVSAGVK